MKAPKQGPQTVIDENVCPASLVPPPFLAGHISSACELLTLLDTGILLTMLPYLLVSQMPLNLKPHQIKRFMAAS